MGPSGDLLACTEGTRGRSAPVLYAPDARNWSAIEILGLPVTSDCAVAIAPSGTLHAAFSAPAGTFVATSYDQGASWAVVPIGPGEPLRATPSIVADARGVHVLTSSAFAPTRVTLSSSRDEGKTWQERSADVGLGIAPVDATIGDLAIGGNDLAYARMTRPILPGGEARLEIVASRGGGSWEAWPVVTRDQMAADIVPTVVIARGNATTAYPVAAAAPHAPAGAVDIMLVATPMNGTFERVATAFESVLAGDVAIVALDARSNGALTVAAHARETLNGTTEWRVLVGRVADGLRGTETAKSPPSHAPGGPVRGIALRHDADGAARVLYPARESRCSLLPTDAIAPYCVYVLRERFGA